MKRTKRIKNILENNFLDYVVNIIDNSYMHKGHNNFNGDGETHILIELKKREKININRLEIHKKINSLLKNEFNTGLHSLQIKII